jgi:hypothetical protein
MYVLYAIRCTLHAIRDACSYTQYEIRSTNSYVRNYKKKMQNKANFQKSQINVSDLLTMNYVKMDTWSSGKNKANSKPIQSQFKPNTCPPSVWRDRGEKPDFSLENNKVNFRAQRIDDSVQICYMAETVFFVKFSSCSLLRGLKCESWKNLKQLSKMEQFSSVIVFVVV